MTQSSSPASPIYQQIEGSADYYEPAVYDLLTFYSVLSTEQDELDGQFIPLTDAGGPKGITFAVGVLAPSSNVTGNILDRSASVQAQTSNPTQNINIDPGTYRAATLANGGSTATVDGVPGSDKGPPIVYNLSVAQAATAIRDAYVQRYGTMPSAQTLSILTAQSMRETSAGNGSVNWKNFNAGNIGNWQSTGNYQVPAGQQTWALANSNGGYSYFATYPTAQAGALAFVNQIAADGAMPAANSGDLDGYVAALGAHKYFGNESNESYQSGFPSLNYVQGLIGNPADLDSSKIPPPNYSITGDAFAASSWSSSGTNNANQAQQTLAQTSNQGLNMTGLGQQYLQQQQAMIQATLLAIQTMQNTPPLRMLVNPKSFKLSADKILSTGEWGRNGPIIEHWGDGQDKIEASGTLAAFYSLDAAGSAFLTNSGMSSLGSSSGGPGLTRISRQYSTAYQNFLSLWLLYKNNGGIWFSEFVDSDSSKPNNLSVLGSIYIYYDGILYFGSFDSFNISETETAPFTLEYNWSFTVRATFLLDQPTDQQFTYGAPQYFNSGQAPSPQVSPNGSASPIAPNVNTDPNLAQPNISFGEGL